MLAAWLVAGVSATFADAGAPCAACLAVLLTPGQTIALPEQLAGTTVLVRAEAEDASVLTALEDIARRGARPGLAIDGLSRSSVPRALVPKAAVLLLDLRRGRGSDPTAAAGAELDTLAFAVKTRLIAGRAAATRFLEVGVAAPAPVLAALLARDLASYVDFLVQTDDRPFESGAAPLWRAGGTLTSVTAALERTQTDRAAMWVWEVPESMDQAVRVLQDLARAAPLLPAGLVPAPAVRLACAGESADAYLNPQTMDTIAVAHRCPSAEDVVAPSVRGVERVALSDGGAIIRVRAAGADRFSEAVRVLGARQLSGEEIIARHQATAARQAAMVHELVETGTQTLSFEAPGFPAPIAISAETTLFVSSDRTDIEQRAIRVNGIAFPGDRVPRLPIIEPERVAAPPLTITLTGVYRYRLAGRETTAGTRCYVVAFEPRDPSQPLFRGRAWIAIDSFAMVKVAATQTGLRGPIVASEQDDEFTVDRAGLSLLRRSEVRQMYEGAAHRTPIHRVLSIVRHEVNPPDFVARRRAAYASGSVMLRDTPQGYRYLQRADPSSPSAAAEPALAGRADRVRTFAAGVIVDPNITRPLPFAGLSYVDFDLFGTGSQLNVFVGGTYGQLAFSVPSIAGGRWQVAGRAFGIASAFNDRAFVNGRERYDEDIRQRPAQAAVWLLRPLTPRISVRIGWHLDYTHFAAGAATDPVFVVPAHQLVHGARLAVDAQRGGWNGSVWWNPARRARWRPWGRSASGEYDPRHQDFQRYGASIGRSVILGPGLVTRLEAEWMAGRDLDRFSRYAFGTFDNRLRGYPSALIRYDRGGVVRGALAWAPGRFARVDAFLDSAAVHDPGFGPGLRNYTGLGGAVEAPAPFGILLAVEWGYGVRGVNADGRLGTQVIRVSAYKVF